MRIKKGDKVVVIAGKSRGETGTITRAFPRKNMVLLEGINMVKRHRKPNAKNRNGQIVDMAQPIHASNVMIVDPKSGKPTRIKITRDKEGSAMRVAIKSGQELK